MYKNKNGKIGIIITIIILIFLVIITNLNNDIWSKIVSPFTKITMTVQDGVTYLKNKISQNDSYFASLETLQSENEELKDENEKLKQENQELEILKAENETLKEYMDLSEEYSEYTTIPGYVIQKDFSNYSKTVVINVGTSDGVEIGMTVVTSGGLVGYVISAEEDSSKVQTIIDTASAVSGLFKGTEKSLVARGILDSNEKIKGTYIDNDVEINVGDTIVTSGIGGIYQKNITIGEVEEIVNTSNKTNRYVYIKTAVDFENLGNVLVIKE